MGSNQRIPVPDFANWTADTLISVSEAVAYMVSETQGKGDDERSARDRARHLLADHIGKGTLVLAEARLRRMRVGELGRFLRERLPGAFPAIPADIHLAAVFKVTAHERATLSDVPVLPSDLGHSHAEITRLAHRVGELEDQLRAANARISELEPHAERRREIAAKNSASAKLPRGKRGS